MSRTVLVTGGTGYLGSRIARRCLEAGDDVVLTTRTQAAGDRTAEAFGPLGSRATFVATELGDDQPFASFDDVLENVTHIAHAGAAIRFNVERDLAQQVNVDGTRAVIDLARRSGKLESLCYVSSVYSTGLRSGAISEQAYDDSAGFANSYEWSKWAAERLVLEAASELPCRIARVATVVADDTSGTVTQYNAFHEALKLCFYGLLSVLPGAPGTPLYFVPGDFAAASVVEVLTSPTADGIYHVAQKRPAAVTLGELLDIAFGAFEVADDFRKKRILRPLLADEPSFRLLVDGVSSFAGSLVSQALENVAPFAGQLYVDKDLDVSRLHALLANAAFPPAGIDTAALVRNTCDYLVRTRWGRRDG